MLSEQIKAFTPVHKGGSKGVTRIGSAQRRDPLVPGRKVSPYDRGSGRGSMVSQKTYNQIGPQKTLLQKYDQLDKETKK